MSATGINEMKPHFESGPELLKRVRAAFVLNGSSFNAWCRQNRIIRRTAEQALNGENQSQNAQQLLARIVAEAGLANQ